jgi:hypothetical protein
MWIRLSIVLLGIVVMINGCNSLISQHFGTHKLRSLELETVLETGLADADFVLFEAAELTEDYLVGKALRDSDEDYHLYALLTPKQKEQRNRGERIVVGAVGWFKIPYADCVKNGDCTPPEPFEIQGLITAPTERKNPVEQWELQNMELADEVIYLQLWKEPLSWYWNLLLFLGGLGLAIGVEAWWQKRRGIQ